MAGDSSYQIYQLYYKRAEEAEKAGRLTEARNMYLYASEALYRTAKATTGATRTAHMNRAEKLQRIADSIQVQPRATGLSPQKKPMTTVNTDAGSSDESSTVWSTSERPNIEFDDIAGLEDVKESIRQRIILPRLYPEVYEIFKLKVSGGILLYGPPGTGKTMIAKAVAHEVDAKFFSVRCSDIVGKYFGEAEKNIKSLFETARACESAVIFLDEFEALGAKRGGNSTVMNRLVPELLSQMDGFSGSEKSKVMVLAATNRPWDIDSAFLRPPRLTEKIYVGLPDVEARLYIIEREFVDVPCGDDLDLQAIAQMTEGYNAADIVELCRRIKVPPKDRTIESKKNGQSEISVVSIADVEVAMRRIKSSVQQADIERIRRWENSQGK